MATFTYVARDTTGVSTAGEIAAPTQAEATRMLRGEGKYVVKLQEAAAHTSVQQIAEAGGSKRVKRVDVIFFVTQMALMVETGVPIAEAIEGIVQQSKPGALKRALADVLKHVESGEPFSEALSRHPKVFSNFFVNLVRAAEMSGRLGETLQRLAAYMASQHEITTKVRMALMYPAALLLASFGTVIFLLTYLLPKFTVLYKGKEELLPLPTTIVVGVSDWMVGYWPFWVGGIVLTVVANWLHLRTPTGRKTLHFLMLNMPITGKMVHKAMLTRSLHTLGTLIDSGVSVLDGVAITKRVVGNHYFEQLWEKVNQDLQKGHQLSEPLYATKLFPRPITQTIEAGEKSGQLGMVMKRVSDWLENDLKESIAGTTRLIEPLMIAVIGSIVGIIAMAMLLPIFTFARTIGH
jgi:type IV pilus assembly protein PilC